jgi:uncharacterized protein (TIGR00730 family)
MRSSQVKKILVFCGSLDGPDPAFAEAAQALGRSLGRGGYELVYGGGFSGLMGRVAKGAMETGGTVTGIIPKVFFNAAAEHHPEGYKEHLVESMMLRKEHMLFAGDIGVALPGGLGALDEVGEMIEAQDVRFFAAPEEPAQPLILVNLGGFFDGTRQQLEKMYSLGFVRPGRRELIHFVDDVQGAIKLIDRYRRSGLPRSCDVYKKAAGKLPPPPMA